LATLASYTGRSFQLFVAATAIFSDSKASANSSRTDQRQSNLFFAHMARIVTGQPLHSLAQPARAIPISKTSSFCFESLQDTFQIEAIFPGILRRVNGGRVLFDHQPAIVAVRTERLDHVRYPCYPQAQRGKDKAP